MNDQDRFILLASLWLVYTIALLLAIWTTFVIMRVLRRRLYTTSLRGPPKKEIEGPEAGDISTLCFEYAPKYGPVFQVCTGIISRTIVICDPLAIGIALPTVLDLGWFQRKGTSTPVLEPAFNDHVWERFAPIFFDMAHKVESMWNTALASRPRGMVIDIQHWMNSVVLDSIGMGGFSHDFKSLDGDYCTVTAAFYALRTPGRNRISDHIFRLTSRFPMLRRIPTAKNRIIRDFRRLLSRIAAEELERIDSGKTATSDGTIIASLVKSLAESPEGELRLSSAEMLGQSANEMSHQNTLLFSGFETTAVTLSWLLVELARNPSIQEQLVKELQTLNRSPNYSEICQLPYLDAIVCEVLRTHPPIGETTRVAIADDVIPLSSPVITKSGETVTSINVAKGTLVTAPIRYSNASEALWGPGCLEFDPGRWLTRKNNALPGNRHLGFGHGPRICIGASFAVALMKVPRGQRHEHHS
ncbi:cytochrome P450 [Mycena rebaudengoi]|nr:cytochrome P450 [Mycena rebaudengoi]